MEKKDFGLYESNYEKDSCGIGLFCNLSGEKNHDVIKNSLNILKNLDHRGATGKDRFLGDGAGILTQIPSELFSKECGLFGDFGVGMIFVSKNGNIIERVKSVVEKVCVENDLSVLFWRKVPVNPKVLGFAGAKSAPDPWQVFISKNDLNSIEGTLFVIKKLIIKELRDLAPDEFYINSLSSKTIVYKGLTLPSKLADYFIDLKNTNYKSSFALVHSRFSTNTFPSWHLAHPFRYLCHNGEINTIKGNINSLSSKETDRNLAPFSGNIYPIIEQCNQSDSATLDNAVEFLVNGGKGIEEAISILIPPAWENDNRIDKKTKNFFEYNSSIIEPWDGPAAVCFTDGEIVGAALDRNGLRPCRYEIFNDNTFVLSSEAGVLKRKGISSIKKGKLSPGEIISINLKTGVIAENLEIRSRNSSKIDYELLNRYLIDLPDVDFNQENYIDNNLLYKQIAFGYTYEELKLVLSTMAIKGEEPVSSMGNDTPLAVFSKIPHVLFRYFRQQFAQVTNPPIDSLREGIVMSLSMKLGSSPSIFRYNDSWKKIRLKTPVIKTEELNSIKKSGFNHKTIDCSLELGQSFSSKIEEILLEVKEFVESGGEIIILSDRMISKERTYVPSLLVCSAVNQFLTENKLKELCDIIVESGEPRDVHHLACLIGYGAAGVCPYLAFSTVLSLKEDGFIPDSCELTNRDLLDNYIKALNKGILKILSKMGVSTCNSYKGSQLFESVGINSNVISKYFKGTSSKIEGMDILEIQKETELRHYSANSKEHPGGITDFGEVHYRKNGEHHNWNPETIVSLQIATRENDPKTFKEFSEMVNNESSNLSTIRGILEFRLSKTKIPLSEIEPATEIVKRFTTGAMSMGAISREAHETLAVAMNRIGGKSNSGEGGEDSLRFKLDKNSDSRNSAIKQVASGRFGVTIEYLTSAKEIQIKVAQGAKPGEGGQLPGHKVDEYIAKLRNSTPGIQLISPPPHHDIYSIEDLKQLIFDLKNANPDAEISVKLVSESGVGVIAAGVVKACADKVLISGDSGGTGASPLSSIKYAGTPWELGLAETHQTLVLNGLRSGVKIETDGQMKTGRDVAIAALLGADEFGFATAPLIVEGCIMMRKCHLNTCPVGIATQDPDLRKKFTGKPEHIINYFFFVAEELRLIMSELGFRKVSEMIGRSDRLQINPIALNSLKTKNLDFSKVLFFFEENGNSTKKRGLRASIDSRIIKKLDKDNSRNLSFKRRIKNTDRSVGTLLSNYFTKKRDIESRQITLELKGSAGQSLGAFLSKHIEITLIGEANDYVGKGLSGGTIAIKSEGNNSEIIVGNTCFYGATSGNAFIAGKAGERFLVRNSGATVVVEGIGENGCEYMTGGVAVILGKIGKNFAAGMSGGVAFIFNDDELHLNCNKELVEIESVFEETDLLLLKSLISEHLGRTDSFIAKDLLENWEINSKKFFKVIPFEYKKILKRES